MKSTELTLPARAAVALQSQEAEAHLRSLIAGTVGIVAVTNRAGRDECHRAAMSITKARTAIVAAGTAARDDANKFSKAVIEEQRRLCAIVEAEEARLKALRDGWDAEQARIREAAAKAEQERAARIMERIQEIRDCQCKAAVATIEQAEDIGKWLVEVEIDASFGEFSERAINALNDARASVASIIASKVAAAEEAARIKAEAEAARVAAEEAAAKHAEELAELRKAAEKAHAEQQEAERVLRAELEATQKAEREAQAKAQSERDRVAAEELRVEREAAAKVRAELAAIQAEKDAKEAAEREAAALEAQKIAEQQRVAQGKKDAAQKAKDSRIQQIVELLEDMDCAQLDRVLEVVEGFAGHPTTTHTTT